MVESGLRPANTQLNNLKRRWAKPTKWRLSTGTCWNGQHTGESLETFLGYPGRTEETVLPETATDLDAGTIIMDTEDAKRAEEGYTPDFTVYTDGSRTEEGATGYSVVCERAKAGKDSRSIWATIRKPTTQSVWPLQEHWKRPPLELNNASWAQSQYKQRKLGAVTIFTDAQAASQE